ncbi:intermembrane lipid transfer protein VPS13B isoform X2 [Daktulosphaira vitifoliae]|nr:intermembrane lipid transfer protein VPS13B isoform X2 [Daktulosphaira vitifoliae]
MNISSGLIHRIEFINNLILSYDSVLFTTQPQSLPKNLYEKQNNLLKSNVELMVYQITIFNPVLKIYPACHIPLYSQKYRKNQKTCTMQLDPLFENPPVAIIELKVIDCRIVTPKNRLTWSNLPSSVVNDLSENIKLELKNRTIIRIKELLLKIELFKSIYRLVKINNIMYNITFDCYEPYSSDNILDTDMVTISTSKENCLIIYYIISSLIMSNHRRLLHAINYIFTSTLMVDAPGVNILKVMLEGIKVLYKLENKISYTKITLNNCATKIINHKTTNHDIEESTVILSTFKIEDKDLPFLQIIFQNPHESVITSAIPLIFLKIGQLDMNFDPLFFDWLIYMPKKSIKKEIFKKTSSASDLAFFSVSSRKISETSINSDHRMKTPKTSIQSSISENVSFQSAKYLHIKSKSKEMGIVHLYNKWKSLIMIADASKITLYFPSKTLSTIEKNSSSKNHELYHLLQKAINIGDELVVLRVMSISLKCAILKQQVEQYLNMCPIKCPENIWSNDGVYFPWQMNLCNLEMFTVHNSYELPFNKSQQKIQLLQPFNAQCTLAITIQYHNNNPELLKSLAACIHCDSDPILLNISEHQVCLISYLCKNILNVYKAICSNIQNATLFNYSVAHEMSSILENETVENKLLSPGISEEHIKLSGWFQWTLARLSLTISNYHKQYCSENIKLVLELEDVISSLDFGISYHKLKLKISSASIQHFMKNQKEQWNHGPYLGIILKGYDLLNILENSSKTDGFLNVTITRALKSSFKKTDSNMDNTQFFMISDDMLKSNRQVMKEFIMEIVIKVQPIDIVLSPIIIHKFLCVIDPLIDIVLTYSNYKYSSNSSDDNQNLRFNRHLLSSYLPLFYLDLSTLRIFIPISFINTEIQHQDTVVVQIDSIKVDQNPENPITRTPIRKDLYIEAEKRGFLSIPGSIMEDRQYQIMINNISLNCGLWIDFKQVLENDQFLSCVDVDHHLNAALLWNEGIKPKSVGSSNFDDIFYSKLSNNLSFHSIFAPGIFYEPENTLVCGSWIEINAKTEINLMLSIEQLNLLNIILSHFELFILSHLKNNNTNSVLIESTIADNVTQTKDDYLIANDFEYISVKDNKAISKEKLISKMTENKIPMDLIITSNQINLNFFKNTLKNEIKTSEPLIYIVFHQPHVFFSNTYNYSSCQVILFDIAVFLPPSNKLCNVEVPNIHEYSMILFETKSNIDEEIPQAFFTLKIACPSTVGQNKIDLNIGRAISLFLNKYIIEHVNNLFNGIKENLNNFIVQSNTTYNINNDFTKPNDYENIEIPSTDESSTSYQYDVNNLNLKKKEYVTIIGDYENELTTKQLFTESSHTISQENHWYSKPIFFSLTTQQIFILLSTLHNENIALSIENIKTKLNSLWKIPSERLNSEVTLNSVTMSVGHNWPNSNTNNLVLYPWTVSMKINLTSDSWVPESYRPAKLIKMNSDYISFHVSPNHCDILKLILNEFKFLVNNEQKEDNYKNKSTESYEQFYRDDLRAGAFQFIECESPEFPLPYQILLSENVNSNPPRITWKYPQPRTLTKIEIQPIPTEIKEDITLHLQWFDEMEHSFKEYISFIFPKDELLLLRLDSLKSVSNVWRITLDNSCIFNSPIEMKCLIGCLRVDSYFSPTLVSYGQFSFYSSSLKVNILYNLQKKCCLSKYDCISYVPQKHKLISLILNQANVGFKLREGEISSSAQAHIKIELLNYGTLTQMSFIKLYCSFTSLHLARPIPNIQYNIQTGSIICQLSPSMMNTLRITKELWENNLCSIAIPYVICNDTNFPIIFGQSKTNEEIIVDSFQCYHYTWFMPFKNPLLRFAIGNAKSLFWSDDIIIRPTMVMSFTLKKDDGKSYSLILSSKYTSTTIKIVISSQLNIINKTHYFLDARLTKIKPVEEKINIQQSLIIETLPLNPNNISPSMPLHEELKLTLKLRFSSVSEGPWSGPIPLYTVELSNKNKHFWLVKIPKKENTKQFRCVWCRLIIEFIDKIPRILILIMPMYNIRSYLPYDILLNFESNENICEPKTVVQIKSAIDQSDMQPIDLPGTMKNTYDLTIKLNEESSGSSPSVPISYYNNTECKESTNDVYFTIEDILNGKCISIDTELKWPFIGKQFDDIKWKQTEVPDTQTTVKVLPYGFIDHDDSSSRIILIQPWALIINTSGQAVLLSDSLSILCSLENYCVVAPPLIESTFYIDISIDGSINRSQPLQLSKNTSFSIPHVKGLIPVNGNTSVVINGQNSIGYLNISSIEHNEIRIVHIQSLYVATNHSIIDINILPVCVKPALGKLLNLPESMDTNIISLPKNYCDLGKPLTLWAKIDSQIVNNEDLVQYIILIFNGNFSCPIKISEIMNEKYPMPVLFSSCDLNPLICVTLQKQDSQYFITIYNQPYPQIIFYNYCHNSLKFAVAKKNKNKIKEPVLFSEDWNWTFTVSSGKKGHLSFPYSMENKQLPKILIGINRKSFIGWFSKLELLVCDSRLITVPGEKNDIKITIKKKGLTLHVVLKPAAQFEFSANEVRLRLANYKNYRDLTSNDELLDYSCYNNDTTLLSFTQNEPSINPNIIWPSIKCYIHTFIFTLLIDDFGFNSKPITAVTLDNIAITLNEVNDLSKKEIDLTISILNVQIDNHTFLDGHYDFPVILVKQKNCSEEIYINTNFDKPLSQLIEDVRALDSNIYINLILVKANSLALDLLDLEVHFCTLEAFIEDRFCYSLLEILKNFRSTPSPKQKISLLEGFIPLHIMLLAYSHEFRNPLVFRNFTIKPFKILLSLHTSTTFYVALDRSPLEFAEFSKSNLITSSYQLGRSLSLHYFLNAIYGTGWALGSLEFWGSPGGLARSVGTGLYDFVSLSAQGITEGPKEFFVGVLSGSGSLVKHITTGALTSVTKFASSWSRTFNRLTLEVDDLEEIEEIRRLRPQNLSQGIIQGLSEFGISLLGAVGGLVNHPIQYALQEGPERKRGFVNTIAIGLVEVFTKPISGAAELVAMTGEGFLAGVGWIKTPQLRNIPNENELYFGASELRYSWLIFNNYLSIDDQIFLICDATIDNCQSGKKFLESTLLLTKKCLFLINDPNNISPVIQQLPITHIVTPCIIHEDPTLVSITICMPTQNNTMYGRVADFVRQSQSYLNVESKTEIDDSDKTQYLLMVNPQIRNHLLNFIEFLKRHTQNKGFTLL